MCVVRSDRLIRRREVACIVARLFAVVERARVVAGVVELVAGILLEREGNAVIVGMGVNLVAAPDLPDRRTIALTNFGPPPDREIFARSLSYAFDQELDRWRTYGLEPLIRRWESVAHPRGASLTVNVPGEQRIEGAFDGLTAEGTLRLRLEDGSTRAIHAGDVMLANEGN